MGGAILIGGLALLLFIKKRRSGTENQLPDFAEDSNSDGNEKAGGFMGFFGQKRASRGSTGGVSGYNDLENHWNQRSAAQGAAARGAYGSAEADDFEYRGVTNSNNLDSVFRSSGSNTGQNSGHSGTPRQGHSRYNSVTYPALGTMHEDHPEATDDAAEGTDIPYPLEEQSPIFNSDKSSDYDDEDDFLFNREPQQVPWDEGAHSNNSRLRFTEEI